MHSYYRARLAEAFMPPVTGDANSAQRAFDFPLASVAPDHGAPLPIIARTLNVNNSPQPTHRSRGAAWVFPNAAVLRFLPPAIAERPASAKAAPAYQQP